VGVATRERSTDSAMSDLDELRDLYQEVILDHNRRPRNFRVLEDANRTAEGYNPLCGDKVAIFLRLEDDVVREIAFQGSGCAISKASASLLTEAVKGRRLAEVDQLFERFHRMVTAEATEPVDVEGLGKLAVFAGVREYPARVKCATLAWHTLRAAVEARGAPVSTE
jgi:nitrogen fixation NifU-like protein